MKHQFKEVSETTDQTETHLVSQNTDGAGGGDLPVPKPQGRQFGGDAQDEDGCHCTYKLPEESHGIHVSLDRSSPDPGADGVEARANQQDFPQAALVQQQRDGQDEWNVGDKVSHGEPVDGLAVGSVEVHDDVAYDAVLQPHEAVAHGVGAEDEQHGPSPPVKLGLHDQERRRWVQI